MEYLLVLWPWVQELMDYPWFRKECYLMQGHSDQVNFDSSYFVPCRRLHELDADSVIAIMDGFYVLNE